MRNKFKIKQNDTLPQLKFQLKPAVDLTGATVVFNMRTIAGSLKINRKSATVESIDPPIVGYQFDGTDTNTVDSYEGEFEVTFADSNIGTFPNDGYIPIEVTDDIA